MSKELRKYGLKPVFRGKSALVSLLDPSEYSDVSDREYRKAKREAVSFGKDLAGDFERLGYEVDFKSTKDGIPTLQVWFWLSESRGRRRRVSSGRGLSESRYQVKSLERFMSANAEMRAEGYNPSIKVFGDAENTKSIDVTWEQLEKIAKVLR